MNSSIEFFCLPSEAHGILLKLFAKLLKYLFELNIFQTYSSLNDPYKRQTQRISTRISLVLLLMAFLVLLIYTATATSVHTFTVNTPSHDQFKQLHQQYAQTLICPCSQISNKLESFVTIDYMLHPVCDSMYITDRWIDYTQFHNGRLSTCDFRFLARQTFPALRSLCQLANEAIKMSLDQFNSTGYISAVVTSEELLQSQLEMTIEQFIASTTNNFLLTLRTIGNTTQANALQSGLLTNAQLALAEYYFMALWKAFDECTCAVSSGCTDRSGIYEDDLSSVSFYVPGIYCGCYIIETLRQSDLRCFFDQSCLNDLQSYLPSDQSMDLISLNSSRLRLLTSDMPIGMLVDHLMVDDWKWNISHSKYFDACQPNRCTYTVVSRDSFIIILTNLFGLFGGLVTALTFLVPPIVWLVRWAFNHRSQRNVGMLHVSLDFRVFMLPHTSYQHVSASLFEKRVGITHPRCLIQNFDEKNNQDDS